MTTEEPQEPPEDVMSPEVEEWVRHPHTRFVADHMAEQAGNFLRLLIDACHADDASPRCARLAAQYVMLVRTEMSMRGKKP